MQASDREIQCISCGRGFLFSAAEQAYFDQQGFQPPRRCRACRAERKAQQNGGGMSGAPRRDRNAMEGAGSFRRGPSQGRGNAHDPNGYRSPMATTSDRGPQRVDYSGLPREEGEPMVRESRAEIEARMGMRTSMPSGTGAPNRGRGAGRQGPRFGNGNAAPRDRAGTDPDAYRAPGFASNGGSPTASDASAERRQRRMRHEAICEDCGVQAFVPFQPGPGRPAYCKPCYQTRKANGTVPFANGATAAAPSVQQAESRESAPASQAAVSELSGE